MRYEETGIIFLMLWGVSMVLPMKSIDPKWSPNESFSVVIAITIL
jgi:hypothetical protein